MPFAGSMDTVVGNADLRSHRIVTENTYTGHAVHLRLIELEELFDLFTVVAAAPGLGGVADPFCIGSKQILDLGPIMV